VGEKKDFICPKCGRRMELVAAGYYCWKDDYLVSPTTGLAIEGEPGSAIRCARCGKRVGGFLQDPKIVLRLEDGEKIYCPVCFYQVKGEYASRKVCDGCVHFVGGSGYCNQIHFKLTPAAIPDSHYAPRNCRYYFVQAEKCVYYMSRQEYERKAIKGESVPELKEGRTKKREIVKEKEVVVKIKCPYCGKLYDEALDVCPHCGGKR
jgi:DNA-directed RNA polymerase subunit RPC12/RpoP